MKLSVVLLMLLTLQSRAQDDSIMGIISKLVNKMEEKYPSGDILAGHIDEFKAHEETDSERDQSLHDAVLGQAEDIETVKESLQVVEEEVIANRDTYNAKVDAVEQGVAANGDAIAEIPTAIEEANKATEEKMQGQLDTQDGKIETLKQDLGDQVDTLQAANGEMQGKIEELTEQKAVMQAELKEYKERVAKLEDSRGGSSSQSSSFLWIIDNYARSRRNRKKITSSTFYSSTMGGQQYGYKMQVYAYLHNKGHLSLFFKLLRGTYDDIQTWPFPYHVQFELLPQRTDVSIMRNTTSISADERTNNPDVFGRPRRGSNTGWGFTQFIEEKQVEEKYLDHDKIYVRVTVV